MAPGLPASMSCFATPAAVRDVHTGPPPQGRISHDPHLSSGHLEDRRAAPILGEQGAEQLHGAGDMLYMGRAADASAAIHTGPFFVSERPRSRRSSANLKTQCQPQFLRSVNRGGTTPKARRRPLFRREPPWRAGWPLESLQQPWQFGDAQPQGPIDQLQSEAAFCRSATLAPRRLMERMKEEGVIGPANHRQDANPGWRGKKTSLI